MPSREIDAVALDLSPRSTSPRVRGHAGRERRFPEEWRSNLRASLRSGIGRGVRPSLQVELLEPRSLMTNYVFSQVFVEGSLVNLLSGQSEEFQLRGSATIEVNEVAVDIDLDGRNEYAQRITALDLRGFDALELGNIHVGLSAAGQSLGQIEERLNNSPTAVELPAINSVDLLFQFDFDDYDFSQPSVPPQRVSWQAAFPARIEGVVSSIPAATNETLYLTPGIVPLVDDALGSTGYALKELQVTLAPQFASIRGQKFDDVNQNGLHDPSEPGVNGWVVAALDGANEYRSAAGADVTHDIDLNGDGTIDPATERGWYVLSGLPPGQYFVAEVPQPGWRQVVPGLTEPFTVPASETAAGWLAGVTSYAGSWGVGVIADFDWPEDGNLDGQVDESVFLSANDGTVSLAWSDPVPTVPPSLTLVQTELGTYDLSGVGQSSSVRIAGGDGAADLAAIGAGTSPGDVRQTGSATTAATAAFDLDFTLTRGAVRGVGGVALVPDAPLRIAGTVNRLPLDGFPLESQSPVTLRDDQNQPQGKIVRLRWAFFQEDAVVGSFGYNVGLALGQTYGGADFADADLGQGPFGFDFGDAPDGIDGRSYPTLEANDGARHGRDGRYYLGAALDAEQDATMSSLALGDDNASVSGVALDDEDGVAFHGAAVVGQTLTLDVTASRSGLLNAWFDFNADGDWADVGEQIFVDRQVLAGINTLTVPVPSNAAGGQLTFARFRYSTAAGLSYTGAAPNGEVEDYAIQLYASPPPASDYGDAPDSASNPGDYPTLNVSNGARHTLSDGRYLGNFVDGEVDGQSSVAAFVGDDQVGLADEDGVKAPSSLVMGQTAEIIVNATQPGYLSAWIDWNQDGDWNDTNEQIATQTLLQTGRNRLTVAVPTFADGARPGDSTAARFRFNSSVNEGQSPFGASSAGEVEDYAWSVAYPAVEASQGPWHMAIAPSPVFGTDGVSRQPGVAGFGVSPAIEQLLDRRWSEIAEQSYWFRIGGSGPERSLASLRLTDVQIQYAAGQVDLTYGDVTHGDPIAVRVRYALTGFDAGFALLDEVIEITNLAPMPVQVTWFNYLDANINGQFGDADQAVLGGPGEIVQTGQLGGTLRTAVTSTPLPSHYQIVGDGSLRQSLADGAPTTLSDTPAVGVLSSAGDISHAFQWDLSLGMTVADRTQTLSMSLEATIPPVVLPGGGLPGSGGSSGGGGGYIGGGPDGGGDGGGGGSGGGGGGGGSGGGSGGGGTGGGGSQGPSVVPPICRGLCVIDPAIAIGFDFVSQSINSFASVRLPTSYGDNQYTIIVPGPSGDTTIPLAGGITYDFTGNGFPQGVDRFRVLGIESSAAVDPHDPLAFPVVVGFVDPTEDWSLSMTGIPETIYVDPTLLNFREDVNFGVFGRFENGDEVTWKPGQADEIPGLVWGETAFGARKAAQQHLTINGWAGLTSIVEVLADMGDAPDLNYSTLTPGGAAHALGSGLALGSIVDADDEAHASSDAFGDDLAGSDDEDGVTFDTRLEAGALASITVTATGAGKLNAWFDWNADGDWNDSGEHVLADRAITGGSSSIPFAVPLTIAGGATSMARFRLSSTAGLGPDGGAADGEVEDYSISLVSNLQPQTHTYLVSNALVGLKRPDSVVESVGLVGPSSVDLFVTPDGWGVDNDRDGLDDAAQRLTTLDLHGRTTLGAVQVRVTSVTPSVGRLEERQNIMLSRLDVSPYTSPGDATSYFDLVLEVQVAMTGGPVVLHTGSPIRVSGVVSGHPSSPGEALRATGSFELLDPANEATGYFLVDPVVVLSPAYPWKNPINALDIDDDGFVVSLDALIIINELNSPSFGPNGALPVPVQAGRVPQPFYDPSGDNFVASNDALIVINFLNGLTGGAEGELPAPTAAAISGADDAAPVGLPVIGASESDRWPASWAALLWRTTFDDSTNAFAARSAAQIVTASRNDGGSIVAAIAGEREGSIGGYVSDVSDTYAATEESRLLHAARDQAFAADQDDDAWFLW